jgi:hypothetical protein
MGGGNRMKRKRDRRFLATFFGVVLSVSLAPSALAAESSTQSNDVPSYVEIPKKGTYTMDGESKSEYDNGEYKMGTDFYLYIENEKKTEDGKKQTGETNANKESESEKETEEPKAPKDDTSGTPTGQSDGNEIPSGETVEPKATKISISGKLPKTGDYGPDKNKICAAALFFGAGYLVCDEYEKKCRKKA